MQLSIPELALVVLIGPSGSGKSTFAAKHFKPTEVISSDFCRGLVGDDANDQSVTTQAFEVLHYIAGKRLAGGRIAVVDATNVQLESRKPLVALARQYHAMPVAIVFDIPEQVCLERNKGRPDREFGPHVVRQQRQQMRRWVRGLGREGFRYVYTLKSEDDVEQAVVERQRLWTDRRDEHGPFDIIGDVHGCFDELLALLAKLGYEVVQTDGGGGYHVQHSEGRKPVFLGDLVDRGPKTPKVLRLVMSAVAADAALCVPGNHDVKLMRKLRGRDVQITHGLAESLEQLESEPAEFKESIAQFIDGLVSHYLLDEGRLVVAHAGMRQDMQGRASARVRDFALFGETTGETDEYGLPVRYNWAEEYRGKAMVVYGHTPVVEPGWVNGTINVDTGCVFGGSLTALRYPEREIVSVPAARTYYEPAKPFLPPDEAAPPIDLRKYDDLLDIADVTGKRLVGTRLRSNITIREEQAITALEVMSRFAANPKWLVYLPPTMSPCETTHESGLLEHPTGAFDYYRRNGVAQVICEEKHMGSRAVVVVCRDEDVARLRFGIVGDGDGIVYTRTGRRFFEDRELERELLDRLRGALDKTAMWDNFSTDWFCLDCELMPWSLKAEELVRGQYASVGAAGGAALKEALAVLAAGAENISELVPFVDDYRGRNEMMERYREAYQAYCWSVQSLADVKLAPFHLLASEGAVHIDKDHRWHMETLARICQADGGVLLQTDYRVVDVTDEASQQDGIAWWQQSTGRGGEGMVVKPLEFLARGRKGLVQPAVKCRGPEYLRIIYGPEYTAPRHLDRLRSRGLSVKRSLALREFALGIESLERFVRNEPLYRVHECVFGVLALESEPVDPRL